MCRLEFFRVNQSPNKILLCCLEFFRVNQSPNTMLEFRLDFCANIRMGSANSNRLIRAIFWNFHTSGSQNLKSWFCWNPDEWSFSIQLVGDEQDQTFSASEIRTFCPDLDAFQNLKLHLKISRLMLFISTTKRMLAHGQKRPKTIENHEKSTFFIMHSRGSCKAHKEKRSVNKTCVIKFFRD